MRTLPVPPYSVSTWRSAWKICFSHAYDVASAQARLCRLMSALSDVPIRLLHLDNLDIGIEAALAEWHFLLLPRAARKLWNTQTHLVSSTARL